MIEGFDIINEIRFEQEKQLERFSTYHTVHVCSCCSDYKFDEESDLLAARELSHMAETNSCSQFLASMENCCGSDASHDNDNSMCARLLGGEEVALCGSFDYRDAFLNAWENLVTSTADLYNRFMGYHTIACCCNQQEYDGPVEALSAKHRFENYSEARRHVINP